MIETMSKIPITLQLVVLTLALTGFYTMVGQAVPQKEVAAPVVIEIARDVSSEEMAEIGRGIYEGKGICYTCHANTSRYPDLQGIATRAAGRIPGYSALDYMTETLYQPDAYLVEGFNPGMPVVNKPPIGLTDDEILTVIAYLQTLGGTPTVTMETKHAYNGGAPAGAGAAPVAVADAGVAEGGAAAQGPLAAYGCLRCHAADPETKLEGPGLFDVGSRLGRDQLLAALVYHEGDDGLDQVTQAELRQLVAVMAEMKGQG
jgi:cytochrome c2